MDKQLKAIRKAVTMWMLKSWGKRCPEYEKDCPLCKAWEYFDYIFEDPNPSKTEIAKAFKKFEDDQDTLEVLSKTCKYVKYPKAISIPPMYPGCKHPDSKYGVCSRGDECPFIMRGNSIVAKNDYKICPKCGAKWWRQCTCPMCGVDL